MPELPEVERFKRRIGRRCVGRAVRHAVVGDRGILERVSPARLKQRLEGARISFARRYGKYLLLGIARNGVLAMHFGMNGFPSLVAKGEKPPRYTRLQLQFGDGSALAYVNPRRIGRVSLAETPAAFIESAQLGPDALDPKFGAKQFRERIAGRRRDIKSALMDQTLLAGIGNIYSDEILFQARVFPGARSDHLDAAATARIYRAIRRTLPALIRAGIDAEQGTGRIPRGFLLAERHKGGHCPRCHRALSTQKRGARTAYYCVICQKR